MNTDFDQAAAFQKLWTDSFANMASVWSQFSPRFPALRREPILATTASSVTEKVPPKPQHSSNRSKFTKSMPFTLCSRSFGLENFWSWTRSLIMIVRVNWVFAPERRTSELAAAIRDYLVDIHVELSAATGHPHMQREHSVMLACKYLVANLHDQLVTLFIQPLTGMIRISRSLPYAWPLQVRRPASVCSIVLFLVCSLRRANFRSSTPAFGSTAKLQHIPT